MKPLEILLVEDNPGDILLTLENLKDSKVFNAIHVVRDGPPALDFLYRRGEYHDQPRPDLILLDLQLPSMDGGELLARIRSDEQFCDIAVAIATSQPELLSADTPPPDVFVEKPIGLAQLLKVVAAVDQLGLTLVRRP
ncbi:MAG: response regulator [Vulcanimicrobiota bacterium]